MKTLFAPRFNRVEFYGLGILATLYRPMGLGVGGFFAAMVALCTISFLGTQLLEKRAK